MPLGDDTPIERSREQWAELAERATSLVNTFTQQLLQPDVTQHEDTVRAREGTLLTNAAPHQAAYVEPLKSASRKKDPNPLTEDYKTPILQQHQDELVRTIKPDLEALQEKYKRLLELLTKKVKTSSAGLLLQGFQALFSQGDWQRPLEVVKRRLFDGTQYPQVKELNLFIDEVARKVTSYQHAGLPDVETEQYIAAYRSLLDSCDNLGSALLLQPQLKLIHERVLGDPLYPTLSELPWKLARRTRFQALSLQCLLDEVTVIAQKQLEVKTLFSEMGKEDHPLNSDTFHPLLSSLLTDLPILISIHPIYEHLFKKIKNAKAESELPPVLILQKKAEEHAIEDVDLLIGTLTDKRLSTSLTVSYSEKLKRAWNQRITEKTTRAHQAKRRADRKFSEWKRQVALVTETVNSDGDIRFDNMDDLLPIGCNLPKHSTVSACNKELADIKLELKAWPTAVNALDGVTYEVTDLTTAINDLHTYIKDIRFNQVKIADQLTIKQMGNFSKHYKSFLESHWGVISGQYPDTTLEQAKKNIDLEYFKYARTHTMRREKYHFFRRSYFNNKQASWEDIIQHVNGKHKSWWFGYHGGRTKQLLREIGWFSKKDTTTDTMPDYLKNQFDTYNSAATGKTLFTK